jgi:hypothetical protein
MRGEDHLLPKISSLVHHLGHHEQVSFLHSMLRILAKQPQFLAADNINHSEKQDKNEAVSAGAAMLLGLTEGSSTLAQGLMEWVIGTSGDGFAHNIFMHRAAIAAFSRDNGGNYDYNKEDLC